HNSSEEERNSSAHTARGRGSPAAAPFLPSHKDSSSITHLAANEARLKFRGIYGAAHSKHGRLRVGSPRCGRPDSLPNGSIAKPGRVPRPPVPLPRPG